VAATIQPRRRKGFAIDDIGAQKGAKGGLGTFKGQLLTPSHIGDLNRSRVIQALCDHGPLSRAELAKMAGVTRATIGNIVTALLDAGVVEEGEPRDNEGKVGKRGRPLWFGPRAGLSGAVAIGEGHLEAALINARGELLEDTRGEFDPRDPKGASAIAAITGGLNKVIPGSNDGLLGIGVAVPGVCDTATGEIIGSGQVPGLAGMDLVEALRSRFQMRVVIDNDSRAQALGEKWFGNGRGISTYASVQTGDGIGVGMVISGTIYRGRRGEAGEAGHCSVVKGGDLCRCGLSGCWETIATLRWLRAEASRLDIPDAQALDARALVALAEGGSKEAASLLEDYANNLAIGLANLAQILSPHLFILHGDAVGGGEKLRALIEGKAKEHVLGHLRDELEVVLSELDQRAGLLGAAGLVLSETFHLSI
jgi:predicted NBD/HSP70 family sugar kinase